MTDFLQGFFLAVVGSGGLGGLTIYMLRKYIDRKWDKKSQEDAKSLKYRMSRITVQDVLYQAYGRLLFYLYKAIKTGEHNGELDKAFEALQAAEAAKKDLDRQAIAEKELDM